MKIINKLFLFILVLLNLNITNKAEEKSNSLLKNLPSKAGLHIKKIEAMADNSFLILDAPKADPKWGLPAGRSYTSGMPYSSDHEVAFLFGHGQHGHVKKNGYMQDDLWAYDIMAHHWVCLYPGTNINVKNIKVNKDGIEVNEKGQHVPICQAVHGWEQMTYVPVNKSFMFIPSVTSTWLENSIPYEVNKKATKSFIERRKAWIMASPVPGVLYNKILPRSAPWVYDIESNKWELKYFKTGLKPHITTGAAACFVYMSSNQQCFYRRVGNEVWFYNPKNNSWKNVKSKGPKVPFGIATILCYDQDKDRVYIASGKYPFSPEMWYYDVKANTWVDPKPVNWPVLGLQHYSSNNAVMSYDSVNKVIVVMVYRETSKKNITGIYIYDSETNKWTVNPTPLPEKLTLTHRSINGFYSSKLNAHVFHCAGDSRENGYIWMYRYKKAKK